MNDQAWRFGRIRLTAKSIDQRKLDFTKYREGFINESLLVERRVSRGDGKLIVYFARKTSDIQCFN